MRDYRELRKLASLHALGEYDFDYSSLLNRSAYNRAVLPEVIIAILDELDALRRVAACLGHSLTLGYVGDGSTRNWADEALANWRKVTE